MQGLAGEGEAVARRVGIDLPGGWERLAHDWRPANLERIATREVDLDGLPAVFATMLAGDSFGRTVVRL